MQHSAIPRLKNEKRQHGVRKQCSVLQHHYRDGFWILHMVNLNSVCNNSRTSLGFTKPVIATCWCQGAENYHRSIPSEGLPKQDLITML